MPFDRIHNVFLEVHPHPFTAIEPVTIFRNFMLNRDKQHCNYLYSVTLKRIQFCPDNLFYFFLLFRWLPIVAMRPVGPESLHSECVLVVGVSRPKLAALFLTVMLISLFLTFHVLYDSAVYSIQVT